MRSIPELGRFHWSRKWQPTPVFLPGKFHGQRSLVGYSQWGCKELDTTEHARTHTHTQSQLIYQDPQNKRTTQRPSTFRKSKPKSACTYEKPNIQQPVSYNPVLVSPAAAAAKSLQSCPTLCDPTDGQPTRFPRPWDSPGKNTGVGCHFLLQCMKVKSESEVAQSCPTLRYPMDCSLPDSSIHGIFQARVLKWGAIAFSFSQSTLP